MSYEYDFVLIFVSGCTDFLLKVVDALYGVHWLRLSSCLISLAPFCFPSSRRIYFGMAYVLRSKLVCLETIHPVRVKVSMIIIIMKILLKGEVVSIPVISCRAYIILG